MENNICPSTVDYLNYVIDFLPDIIFAIDMEGKVIAWNKQMEIFSGRQKDDAIGHGRDAYSKPFYGFDRKLLIDLVFVEDKESENTYDKFCRKKDGTVEGYIYIPYLNRYMWGLASPIKNTDGNIIGAVESVRDVTDVVDTRRMADLSAQLIDNIPELVWAKDINNRFLFANKQFIETLQIPDKSLKGKKASEIFGGDTKFEDADEKTKEFGIQEYVESVTIHGEKVVWLQMCKMPFFDAKNKLIGTIGSARDITKERGKGKELEESLKKDIDEWKTEQEAVSHKMREAISSTIKLLKVYRENNNNKPDKILV